MHLKLVCHRNWQNIMTQYEYVFILEIVATSPAHQTSHHNIRQFVSDITEHHTNMGTARFFAIIVNILFMVNRSFSHNSDLRNSSVSPFVIKLSK